MTVSGEMLEMLFFFFALMTILVGLPGPGEHALSGGTGWVKAKLAADPPSTNESASPCFPLLQGTNVLMAGRQQPHKTT